MRKSEIGWGILLSMIRSYSTLLESNKYYSITYLEKKKMF